MPNFIPGSRWKSSASSCELVVITPPSQDGELTCAGKPIAKHDADNAAVPDAGEDPRIAMGKRYVDDQSGLEVLASKAGTGPIAFDGRELRLKEAQPLPASD